MTLVPPIHAQKKLGTRKTSILKNKTPVKKSLTYRTSVKKNPTKKFTRRSVVSKKLVMRKNSSSKPARETRTSFASKTSITSNDIKLKKYELDKIRQEIKSYELRLAESKRAERSTLNRLDDYDRQTSLIRTLVSQLGVQVNDNQREIKVVQSNLVSEQKELERLQRRYARTIVTAYKRGRTHDTELLLAAASINQMFIRARYLKAFTLRQKTAVDDIRRTQEAIRTQQLLLEDKLVRQQQTMQEKKSEESVLQKKVVEHKSLLNKLREDQDSYAAQLQRKQQAANKIERLVADLIERERVKRLEQRRSPSSTASSDNSTIKRGLNTKITALPSRPNSQTAFGRLKGRLPWPVSHGAVIGSFGEQVNPRLGTVTISNGIDIRVPEGSAVCSVADGEVSMVYFIAGYGNLVIVNHDDGFFSVYAHLAQINVRDGQKLKAGQTLATSGEGISGPQLHFEIWRERNKQNPLSWLAGR